jgi:RNA polymerase sigma-70 factor (ECF subfamily)
VAPGTSGRGPKVGASAPTSNQGFGCGPGRDGRGQRKTANEISAADVARCRSGDIGGIEAAFRVYGARVFRLCRGLLGSDADAEDATQEVFLRVLEKARRFDGRSMFSTWLYRLTVNLCLNERKARSRRHARTAPLGDGDVADGAPSPVEASGAREARDRVDALLAALSPDHRAVLVLRELDGFSYAQIGEVLGIPVGTVMSRLLRARRRLSACAGPDVEDTPREPAYARRSGG